MGEGPPAPHTDRIQPFESRTDPEYVTEQTNEKHPKKEDYGNVSERYVERIEVEHPAPSVEELRKTVHIQAQYHEENVDQWGEEPFPNDGGVLYDLAILSVAGDALAVEGLTKTETDGSTQPFETIPQRRFNAIFLYYARHVANLTAFCEYLTDAEAVLAELGYRDGFVGYKTFRKAVNEELPAELADRESGQSAFNAAVVRAVYSVFRNGIVPPPQVRTAYGFDAVAPPLSPAAVPREIEKDALGNWVQLLAAKTLAPLTFHRDAPEHDYLQFLGALAASARSRAGLQEVPNELDYSYPREKIPDGSGFSRYVRQLPRSEATRKRLDTEKRSIVAQFAEAHRATLELADQRGFFDEPRSLAVDLYRIDWTGAENALTINRPSRSADDIRSQWTYVTLGIIDTEARFTLGTRWLQSKDQYPSALGELTAVTEDLIPVDTVYADSEIVSGPLMDQMRGLAGSDWVIKAPNRNIVKKLKRLTPARYAGVVRGVSWNTTPKPNLVTYPSPGTGIGTIKGIVEFTEQQLNSIDIDALANTQMTISEYGQADGESAERPDADAVPPSEIPNFESQRAVGNVSSHNAYFTDRQLSELSPAEIHFKYYNRWAIEESINQITNHYLPRITSSDERLRLYGVNISILLQNWHTLINRAPSPKRGIQLDITYAELLGKIIDVAFDSETE